MLNRLKIRFLESVDENLLLWIGKNRAFKLYKKNIKRLDVYSEFLKSNGVRSFNIPISKFSQIPETDKSNYLKKYRLIELIEKEIYNYASIERSSGYSGIPFFWPREKRKTSKIIKYSELGLIKTFSIDKQKTLFLNTFALGIWTTGVKMVKILSTLSESKKYKFTSVNIGTNINDTIEIIKYFSSYFDQVIIAGYPPFVKEVVEVAFESGIFCKTTKMGLVLGGEGFTENFRLYLEKISENYGISKPQIYSAYGTADTGIDIGYEQDITIAFRRLLLKNKELARKVLGNHSHIPHFFQYNPTNVYIEINEKNELLFTSHGGIPLIRYNIHDQGGVIKINEIIDYLSINSSRKKIIEKYQPLMLPCVYVFGRSDGTIILDGANIYIEQIKHVLLKSRYNEYFTGSFYTQYIYDKKINKRLEIKIQMRRNINKKIPESFEKFFIKDLSSINSEFANAVRSNKNKVVPLLTYIPYESFKIDTIKIKYKNE